MLRSAKPLLNRLRHHRGVWALCILVLLFKVVTSAVCLADGLGGLPRSAVTASATNASAEMAPSHDGGGGTCQLGEAGDCHCACAHTLPLTSLSEATSVTTALDSFERTVIPSRFKPAPSGSVLRPPIT
jgi:hypothetical protein